MVISVFFFFITIIAVGVSRFTRLIVYRRYKTLMNTMDKVHYSRGCFINRGTHVRMYGISFGHVPVRVQRTQISRDRFCL